MCIHNNFKDSWYEVLSTQYLGRELGAFLEFQSHNVSRQMIM